MVARGVVLVLLALAGSTAAGAVPERSNTAPVGAQVARPLFDLKAKVTRVVDGDELIVKIGRKTARVGLIGILAPEVKGDCFYDEARQATVRLARGKNVRLLGDRTQGRSDEDRRLPRT